MGATVVEGRTRVNETAVGFLGTARIRIFDAVNDISDEWNGVRNAGKKELDSLTHFPIIADPIR
jgi:hypothetical protein